MANLLVKDDFQTKSAEDKHQEDEMKKISKTLNRYVQNSDPYILSRYDAYMSKQKKHDEDLYAKLREKNSRSQTDIMERFMAKRGIDSG